MSTDSSQLLDNNVAVPDQCMYTVKPSSVRCRQYRASIPSSNGVQFQPQGTSIFYIPARNSCFLSGKETALKYTIRYCSSSIISANTDGFGSSVISRVDVFHGSNLLESISNANVLYNAVWDTVLDPAERVGLASLYGGSSTLTSSRAGATITSTATVPGQLTVCIPLLSATCGLTLDKYLPLGLADDIRVEVTWETDAAGLVKATDLSNTYISGYSTNWVIQSPELLCNIIELDQQGMAIVNSISPASGETILHGTSWRSYNSSMPANTGSYSTLVPARFASLNSILLAPRVSSTAILSSGYSIGNRVCPNMSTYQFRVGGAMVPQKPVSLKNASTTGGYAEALFELLKCFHVVNTTMSSSSHTIASYFNAKTADAQNGPVIASTTDSVPSFLIGQEFSTFSGRSDVLLSGCNTLSSNIFFETEINTTPDAMTLNFFANYDILLIIRDGLISSRF